MEFLPIYRILPESEYIYKGMIEWVHRNSFCSGSVQASRLGERGVFPSSFFNPKNNILVFI